MDINLYKFKKKFNSTKRPSDSGRRFDCTLIENTSLLSPSIRLKAPSDLIGQVKEPVTPGALVTIQDEDALLQEPLPTLQLGVLYDGNPKTNLSFWKTGKNLCGGEFLLENANNYLPDGSIDTTNNTFIFSSNYSTVSGIGGFCGSQAFKYKENTSYTIILTLSKSGSNRNSNMRIYYSDSSYTTIQLPSDFVSDTKYTLVIVTPESKTFNWISKVTNAGSTTLYYNESGIFEGTMTVEDFEAFTGVKTTVNFPSPIYGGYYNADTGILSVTKDSTGADLPTPYQMYQCTPNDVYLNADVTNIWCDTGAVESCYYWKYEEGAGRMYKFNYAYIPDMDRYYWIRDIKYELGTWILDLSIDVLASWKNTIGASSEYVLRAASEKDENVVDTFYPTKNHIDAETQEADFSLYGGNGLSLNPCYLLSVVGPNHQGDPLGQGVSMLASTTYYVLSGGDLELLCYAMMDNVNVFDIQTSELSYALQKQLINPYQYLVDCKLLPWTPDVIQNSAVDTTPRGVSIIPLGFNQLEINGSWYIARIPTVGLDTTNAKGLVTHYNNTIHVTKNPLTSTLGNWVNHSPYSKYSIFVEPFGEIPIPDEITMLSDPPTLGQTNTFPIVFDVTCDAVEGTVRLELQSYNVISGQTVQYIPFYTNTVKVGCSIPLYRTQQNITGAAGALAGAGLSAVGGAIAGGLGIIGGAFKGAASIMSGTDSAMPSLVSNGSMGSLMDTFANLARPRIVKKFASFVDFNNEDNGSPLCKIKRIQTLSGYIRCQDAHFVSSGTEEENKQVTDVLNGGFFYE